MASSRPLRRIAFLGPQGTFSEEALLSQGDLADLDLRPTDTIAEAIDAAASGEVDAAFVPVENSIEGSVNETMDGLIFTGDLLIQREVVHDVHLDVLGVPGARVESVERLLSYPHASAQCRRFIAASMPRAAVEATSSTAEAARAAAAARRPELAALAPPIAAKLYGLEVLAHAVEDHPGNQTRFVLVAPGAVPPPSGHDRTSIVCFQHADRPGSLHQILGQFAARSLNLTRIESRPTKQQLGDYCFVIEVEGHVADEVLGDCLRELHMELEAVKFLGSYPVEGAGASRLREEIAVQRRAADEWLASLRGLVEGTGR